jgi:hypothetical protein
LRSFANFSFCFKDNKHRPCNGNTAYKSDDDDDDDDVDDENSHEQPNVFNDDTNSSNMSIPSNSSSCAQSADIKTKAASFPLDLTYKTNNGSVVNYQQSVKTESSDEHHTTTKKRHHSFDTNYGNTDDLNDENHVSRPKKSNVNQSLLQMQTIANSYLAANGADHHVQHINMLNNIRDRTNFSNQSKPLKSVLPPVSQEQFDKYSFINTDDLVRRVKDLLSKYSISQRLFGEYILGLSQGSVSDLLARPKPWIMLTQKGREPFIRMQIFIDDSNAIKKLMANQYKVPPEKLTQRTFSTTNMAFSNQMWCSNSSANGMLFIDFYFSTTSLDRFNHYTAIASQC